MNTIFSHYLAVCLGVVLGIIFASIVANTRAEENDYE